MCLWPYLSCTQCACVILPSVVCPALQYFSPSHERHGFLFKKVIDHKMCVLIFFTTSFFFDVLLTVHLSIFISVFNQLDVQNLFKNKFYFMSVHVSSTCAHHQEVKIVLHSFWYHHTI